MVVKWILNAKHIKYDIRKACDSRYNILGFSKTPKFCFLSGAKLSFKCNPYFRGLEIIFTINTMRIKLYAYAEL